MRGEYFRKALERAKGKAELVQASLNAAREEVATASSWQEALQEAQIFLQKVAQATQDQLRFHIQDVVQLAIDTCFPGEYQFQVIFEIKRNQTEARLVFLSGGQEVDPLEAAGGGVVDIAGFALRIAAWSLGKSSPVIILDEPFRFLSKDLQPRAGDILIELSKRLGLQFIIVTHNDALVESADRVFVVKKVDGVSQVSVVGEA